MDESKRPVLFVLPSSLFLNRSYGASYDRLREIQPEPGPAEKTPEQLQEIAQVFQVRKNGRPVEETSGLEN